jgi:hypothetical protein
MCVIVHQPKGEHLNKETATKLWNTNPDGGGFAFIDDDGDLQVEKYMDFQKWWSRFEIARSAFPKRDFLIHMRIATHGSVTPENVHPFVVDEHTVMAHNGIIHGVTKFIDEKTDDRSDTRYFIDEVLPRLDPLWLDDPFLSGMVNEWVGWSRLMFLTVNPDLDYSVYRFGDWSEHEGLYLSNKNGLAPKVKSYSFSTKGSEYDSHWYPSDYKVPLPATTQAKKGTETSEEWEMWQDYLTIRGDQDSFPFDDDELDFLLDALAEERKLKGLNHRIIEITADPLQLECEGCLAQIDNETGDCNCFEEVCDGCWQLVGLCEAPDLHVPVGKLISYASLTERGKEFVKNGGLTQYPNEDERKLVAKNLSQ